MVAARRSIGIVAIATVATIAANCADVQAGPRSDPLAVAACAPIGCTESTTLTLPAGGEGQAVTDAIPANATQGSINQQPTASTDQQDFDKLVNTLVSDNPNLIPPRLNQRSKRILTCVFVSYGPLAFNYGDENFPVALAHIFQALALNACLKLVLSFPSGASDGARSASARCGRFDAAVAIQITHSRSGYSGVINGRTHRPSGRPPATISCRRSGRGVLLTIRPRVRGQRLRAVVGPMLSIGYRNPTNKPVSVATTFKVN
jgi:hypothetical protein